jgi:hypothetical protein
MQAGEYGQAVVMKNLKWPFGGFSFWLPMLPGMILARRETRAT